MGACGGQGRRGELARGKLQSLPVGPAGWRPIPGCDITAVSPVLAPEPACRPYDRATQDPECSGAGIELYSQHSVRSPGNGRRSPVATSAVRSEGQDRQTAISRRLLHTDTARGACCASTCLSDDPSCPPAHDSWTAPRRQVRLRRACRVARAMQALTSRVLPTLSSQLNSACIAIQIQWRRRSCRSGLGAGSGGCGEHEEAEVSVCTHLLADGASGAELTPTTPPSRAWLLSSSAS